MKPNKLLLLGVALFLLNFTLAFSSTPYRNCMSSCKAKGYNYADCGFGCFNGVHVQADAPCICCCSNKEGLFLHDQPQPVLTQELKEDYRICDTRFEGPMSKAGANIGLNLYFNPRLVTRDGYVIGNGESVCADDKVNFKDSVLTGEFFGKGGPHDSPPIAWVDNLDDIHGQITSGNFNPETYATILCYTNKQDFYRAVANASVVCSSECETDNTLQENNANARLDCVFDCKMYVEPYDPNDPSLPRHPYGIGYRDLGFPPQLLNLNFTDESLKNFTLIMDYGLVDKSEGPKLMVVSSDFNGNTLYVKIRNGGDMLAKIDRASLSIGYTAVLVPSSIGAGEDSDFLFNTNSGNVKLKVEYRTDELGCLDKKDFQQEFYIGSLHQCFVDSDCVSNLCCENFCRNSSEGTCDDTNRDGIPDTWIQTPID